MPIKKIIRMLAAANHLSMRKLSIKFGRVPTYMTTLMNTRKGMGMDLAIGVLETLGCEVIVRDKSTGMEFVVTPSEELPE